MWTVRPSVDIHSRMILFFSVVLFTFCNERNQASSKWLHDPLFIFFYSSSFLSIYLGACRYFSFILFLFWPANVHFSKHTKIRYSICSVKYVPTLCTVCTICMYVHYNQSLCVVVFYALYTTYVCMYVCAIHTGLTDRGRGRAEEGGVICYVPTVIHTVE